MAAFLLTPGAPIRALDANGDPVSGAKLRVFEAGTSTPLTVYSDLGLTTPHATPIVADSDGYFASIYFTGPDTVKVRVDDASDNVLTTVDHIAGLATSTTGAADTSFAATARLAADDVQEAIEDLDRVVEKTQAGFDRITATGSGNAYVLDTAVSSYTAYASGDVFCWEANHASTGATTLNVDALGAKAIKFKTGGSKTDTASGDIQTGHILLVEYDGTDFVVLQHWMPRATQAQAEAGTAEGASMDPLRTQQAIDAWGPAEQFISRAVANNDATLDFTGFDSTKYDAYKFVIANLVPDTDATRLYVRLRTSGGSFRSGASDYAYDTPDEANVTGAVAIFLHWTGSNAGGSDPGEDGWSGVVFVYGPHLSKKTIVTFNGGYFTSAAGSFVQNTGAGAVTTAEVNDAVRFLYSTGNIESGTITMYGVRNA